MSRVDVIVPCYRYGKYLRKCVDSALEQEGVDVRVLIIDDCSPDETEPVGRAIAEEDFRVEYRRHAANRGHIETYNEGLEWAHGDYLRLLSADDLLTPGALGRAAKIMDEHPEVGMTYGPVIRTTDPRPEEFLTPEKWSWRVYSGSEFLAKTCAVAENLVWTPSAVVRTSVQKKIGGYRKDLPYSGDMEMWLRFACNASVAEIGAQQAYYRLHGKNMNLGYPGLAALKQRREALEAMFTGYPPPNATELKEMAWAYLAQEAFWAAHHLFDDGQLEECRGCLDLALELNPGIQKTRHWSRMRYKQMVGPRVWGMVRPMFRKLAI